MIQLIQDYLDAITKEFNSWRAREHSYRPALKNLLESCKNTIHAVNEPSRESAGAPDFIIMDSKNIPRGYIEAKDIVPNILDDKKNQAQIDKYFDGELGYNFIHTDNIEFRFYRNAELVESVKIAELENGRIIPNPKQFEKLEILLQNFLTFKTQTITSSKKLSEIMAWKARMIKRVIYMTLKNNQDVQTEVHNQYKVFRDVLVHDLDETSFADIYAQTIVYGLFTARLHDPTLPTFDRDEAAKLLPKSNPFLKKFFQSLRDDLDPRIEWIVDDLVEIFLASDVKKLLQWYGKTSARNDPIIHFYEDFLWNYDAKLRKAKGVYYTPEPVVNFMIRGVDSLLKSEFHLTDGIANTSKIQIEVNSDIIDKRTKQPKKTKKAVHKVQILDPATGTGTFLNDIVKYIYESRFSWMEWIWKNYVDESLLPRLHGFEIMMASYAMAHLKLDLTLTETGYKNEDQQRLGIYLTNSLEEEHDDSGTLLTTWLSHESTEANHIKKNMPIMTIIGNPPYSWESSNTSDWIMNLMEDYKKEPGGKIKLQERNSKWINDDYAKFIRFWEHFIEKNGEGLLAFITPHGFLDNPTFRWMRWKLLSDFDAIYTIDLHWNSKKKEVCPDWSVDQNVFDIQQWVSINFFIKTNKKKAWELAKVYHYDLYWKRDFKYNWLQKNNIETIPFTKLQNKAPNYFMVPKNYELEDKYNKGFKIDELFKIFSTWIQTWNDAILVWDSIEDLNLKLKKEAWEDIDKQLISKFLYRSFEFKYLYYIKNFQSNRYSQLNIPKSYRSRYEVMSNFLWENLWLIIWRQWQAVWKMQWNLVTISDSISDLNLFYRWWWSSFPLYLYQENPLEWGEEKIPNFDMEVIEKIEKKLGMKLVGNEYFHSDTMRNDNNRSLRDDEFTPENLLDYIYAVLHSKNYRETYKEFLKIDFPKVPFDVERDTFWKLVKLGEELRTLHLLENEKLVPSNFISSYPVDGDNLVEKVKYQDKKIYINDEQYFEWVPEDVWGFYIGGYQPAQKWLKDRKGRTLSYEDILHYGKTILTLNGTIQIMNEIEEVFKI